MCALLDLVAADTVELEFQAEIQNGAIDITAGNVLLTKIGGIRGATGADGAAGAAGADGAAGTDGTDGAPGAAGMDGATGATGADGAAGAAGADGQDGATGAAGADGTDGADGATGVIVQDSGTEQGAGITTLNFGANISATVTGTEATIVGQAGGGGGGLSAVTSDGTLDGDGTTGDPLMVADGGVDTTQLADDAVTQAKLANNSVHADQIAGNAVDSSEIAADAVGTSELSDDAVTEAKIADSAVGFQQLAANSVREAEIQANAVGHSEMADAAVGVVELRDDAAERLCPDPSTGTSGQVCARNAAGDAYELVAQSGGGGGTDDQTAAEVPVTATGFTGNLGATDTDVQTALETIDGFTLGGGGPAGTGEQRVESVIFADIDNITSTAMTLTLAAATPVAVEFGDGTAEMLTGTAGVTTFTIAASGVYLITFEATYPADGDRATPFVEIQQDSDDAVIGRTTNAYIRDVNSPEDGQTIVTRWRRDRAERRSRGQGGARGTRTTRTASTRTPAS